MGDLFEELMRKFAEASNETAGEHFTPLDAIRLMVELVFANDDTALSEKGVVRTVYDPTAGTGGMLSMVEEHLIGTPVKPDSIPMPGSGSTGRRSTPSLTPSKGPT
jgi:type I restriction enzyme M protein